MNNLSTIKIFKNTSDRLSHEITDEQEKNRLWWEALPMTYVDWGKKERIPKNKEDFLKIEEVFLSGNPYMADFDFERFSGKSVLEIGCGSGAASCLFAKGGANVTAIDITHNAIRLSRANAIAQGLNISFLQQDAEQMVFHDNSFDYVFSWGVLHHTRNTGNALSEMYRVTKKGGSSSIMVYNKNSLRYYGKGLYWLFMGKKLFEGYDLRTVQSFYTDGYYHRHLTTDELRRELESVGFSCTLITITHMGNRMIPLIPLSFEGWIKKHYGWLLVAEFSK
jgi:ubiquinone/menaquinone biosynthesis C-methylase UbiE